MVNSAWAVQSSTALVQLIESKAQAAYVAACETTAEGTPPPEAPVHISDPVDAALKLLMDEDILAAAGGANAAEDFVAVSTKLGTAYPHPALVKALQACATKPMLSLRGWQCDLPSLTALLVVLGKHPSIRSASFWQCGLNDRALTLLERALPASVESLAFEGTAAEGAAVEGLSTLPSVTSLALRCASLTSMPPPLADALRANETLTALSLFGNPLGDMGALELLEALRSHPTLLTLNLGRCGLTDTSAHAVLEMVSDPPKEDKDEEGEVPEAGAMCLNVAILPNRTLTALNLGYNRIGTEGRLALEAAQAASPGLARLELVGNPCLTCGPTAGLGAEPRRLIKASWAALAAREGGAEVVVAGVCAAALAQVPEALPIVGFPVAEGADTKEAPEFAGWEGLAPLGAIGASILGKLVAELDHPKRLRATLVSELGVVCASRGLTPGASFDKFGEALIAGISAALGSQLSEDAKTAWRDAYADAARCMQTAYLPSQLAAAAMAAAAAAAPAE